MTRVVALGGGHGLAASLPGRPPLRRRRLAPSCRWPTTAGSSGRLRPAFGIPPPGDLRQCLVALADPGSLWVDGLRAPLRRRRAGGPRPRQPGHRRPGRRHRRLRGGPGRGRAGCSARWAGWCPATTRAGRAQGGGAGAPTATAATRSRARWRWAAPRRIAGVSLVPADARAPAGRPRGPGRRRPGRDRARLAVHQRAGGGGRPRHPRRPGRHPGPQGLRLQPAGPEPRDRRATTWPPTSTPCGPTASRSTSSCAIPARSPSAGVERAGASSGRWPGPTGRRHDPDRLAAALADLVG